MLLERRLRSVARRLASLRTELGVADEQIAHFAEMSDDSRIRSLVSETPQADQDHRAAERTTNAMQRHREDLLAEIRRLEVEQDDLLDQLNRRRGGQ
jgi:chromosome segregation ATPase